jgi:putative tricarboxylic transport membrane protein
MTGPSPDGERHPNRAAFVIAVGLAALGALLIWEGGRIPDKGGYAGIGSGDMPVIIGWGLVGLAVWHVAAGLRQSGAAPLRQHSVPLILILSGLALQLVLLKPLGFAIASGVLFACTAAAFGKRNLLFTLPVGVGFALLIYDLFDQLLRLNLPAGPLETLIFGA